MFTFYLFTRPPLLFNPVHEPAVRASDRAAEYAALEQRFDTAVDARRKAAAAAASMHRGGDAVARAMSQAALLSAEEQVKSVRAEAVALVREVSGDRAYNDVNYVFPTFVTRFMPIGLPGLVVAAILAAAMSTIAAELSALSTATVIDFYRRFVRREASDAHFLRASRIATAFWGLFASAVAVWAAELGSLIEVVNRFGSFFYGSILGVFILAIGFPRATGTGAFGGLIAGMGAVAWTASATNVSFLWHNVIGAVAVVVVGLMMSAVAPGSWGGARV
jgi:Na+(H+)/acetate symporter ActP